MISAMNALKQEHSSQWKCATGAHMPDPMVKAADFEPEAALEIQEAQGRRLTRLRARLGLDLNEAAQMGRVDRDAWGRAERGKAKINPIALSRFVAAVQSLTNTRISANYVITGSLDGLDDALARELVEAESLEKRGAPTDTVLPSGRKPRGRKRQKSTADTPT